MICEILVRNTGTQRRARSCVSGPAQANIALPRRVLGRLGGGRQTWVCSHLRDRSQPRSQVPRWMVLP